jgi:hypothetical protein
MNQLTEKTIEHLRQELAGAEVESKAKNALLDSYNTLLIAEREKCQRLRDALLRNRQGMRNILEFRKLARTYFSNPDRYGALTREEIEGTIAEIDAALSDTSEEQTNG